MLLIRSRKKHFSVLMAIVLIIQLFSPVFVLVKPALAESDIQYKDVSDHWGEDAIERWSVHKVIQGYTDGTFKPDNPVTRAEFATIINNILKYQEQAANVFTDLVAGQWHYEAILKLNAAGVIEGAYGQADPDRQITRQEAAVMVARAFDVEGSSATDFTDRGEIAQWARDAVQALTAAGALKGFPDGSFRPAVNLTRAEAVSLFDQLIGELFTEAGEYSGNMEGNVVINSSDVIIKNGVISGNVYIAQGVGEGEVTFEDITITGDVYVHGGGEESIIFNNVSVRGALVVNKYDGKVRILATGNISIAVTALESGALIVTRDVTGGGFRVRRLATPSMQSLP